MRTRNTSFKIYWTITTEMNNSSLENESLLQQFNVCKKENVHNTSWQTEFSASVNSKQPSSERDVTLTYFNCQEDVDTSNILTNMYPWNFVSEDRITFKIITV